MGRILKNFTARSFTSHDGLTIYYDLTQGEHSKPTLIFLHGFGGDASAWDRLRNFFQAKGFPTIALDLRGHGFSGRSKHISSYSLDHFAKDLTTLIQQEKVSGYVLIGHCFGGMVSFFTAARRLIQPKQLILIATGYTSPRFGRSLTKQRLIKQTTRLLAKLPLSFHLSHRPNYTTKTYIGSPDISPKRIVLDLLHTSPKSYLSVMAHIITFNGSSILTQITSPTLVLSGSDDIFYPADIAQTLAKTIPHATLTIIPNANHILVLNNHEEVRDSILQFLEAPTN